MHHQALQALHLLDERRHVFHARAADLVAQIQQTRLVIGGGLGGRAIRRALVSGARANSLDALEAGLLLGDDGVTLGIFEYFGH